MPVKTSTKISAANDGIVDVVLEGVIDDEPYERRREVILWQRRHRGSGLPDSYSSSIEFTSVSDDDHCHRHPVRHICDIVSSAYGI